MITLTRIGISLFAVAVVLGPLYTVPDYSTVSNLISELGAQHTQNNVIMISAFVILGATIALDGIKRFQLPALPFICFGLAMGVVGVFPHKPIDVSVAYNPTYHNLHGIIASVAGTALTIGFIWQGVRMRGGQRLICFYLALVSVLFPVLMLSFPEYQGFIQRLMYIQVLGWLWVKYPKLG